MSIIQDTVDPKTNRYVKDSAKVRKPTTTGNKKDEVSTYAPTEEEQKVIT